MTPYPTPYLSLAYLRQSQGVQGYVWQQKKRIDALAGRWAGGNPRFHMLSRTAVAGGFGIQRRLDRQPHIIRALPPVAPGLGAYRDVLCLATHLSPGACLQTGRDLRVARNQEKLQGTVLDRCRTGSGCAGVSLCRPIFLLSSIPIWEISS